MKKLNRIERLKEESLPFEFRAKLEELDWERLSQEERFYLSNYGIYSSSLRPERCMIRLRFDGGRVDPDALRTVAAIAEEERAELLLTARSQIEIHGITPLRLYPIWQRLHEAGLCSLQTLSDNFRALVTDPLSDLAPDSRINTFPLLEAIRERFLNHPEWIGTIPRKFNTALVGRLTPSFNPWSNDLLFALAQREGEWGFNIYLGGRYNETAQSADIFCLPRQVAELFEAVGRTYRKHGLRGSRSKTRLYHLIETEGMARIREWIEEEYGAPLLSSGELKLQSSSRNRDHLLPFRRHGDKGMIDPGTLEQIASEAEHRGETLRLTPHQELWSFQPDELRRRSDELFLGTLEQRPAPYFPRGTVTACAGSRYCSLSLWEIKEDLELFPMERLRMLGVSLGFSGCLKGCGRHYHADLGLIGLRTNLYGPTERAVRIFLGALQAPDPAPGRMLYYSVPLRKLPGLVDAILEDFESSRLESFEEFSRQVLSVYPVEFLQLWYLIRQLHTPGPRTIQYFLQHDHSLLIRELERLEPGCFQGDLNENTQRLSHRLWDRDTSADNSEKSF